MEKKNSLLVRMDPVRGLVPPSQPDAAGVPSIYEKGKRTTRVETVVKEVRKNNYPAKRKGRKRKLTPGVATKRKQYAENS